MAQTVSVIVTAEDRARLVAIAGDRSRSVKHVQRARIVLQSAPGHLPASNDDRQHRQQLADLDLALAQDSAARPNMLAKPVIVPADGVEVIVGWNTLAVGEDVYFFRQHAGSRRVITWSADLPAVRAGQRPDCESFVRVSALAGQEAAELSR